MDVGMEQTKLGGGGGSNGSRFLEVCPFQSKLQGKSCIEDLLFAIFGAK
jgi:hypothetical protein